MRSDRDIRLVFIGRGLYWIGKPFFWLTYNLFAIIGKGWFYTFGFWEKLKFNAKVINLLLRQLISPKKNRKKPKLKRKRWTNNPRWIITGTFFGLLIFSSGIFYWWVVKDLPNPQQLVTDPHAVTTKIYDRKGILLYKVYKNQNRSIVGLREIPSHVINATLAIEDAEFYSHPGFSLKGIFRALTTNFQTNSMQGGSTITQQLVKNALLTREKTLTRKLKELILSLEVEYYFTKDEILSMYFNEVPYGGTAYGIEEAAQQYLGKSIREVTLAEAALLAGLPAAPTIYSPFGTEPDFAIVRQHLVLKRMVEEQMITADEAEEAKKQSLVFATPKTDIAAPHFVMYVKDQLVKQYGENLVQKGGLEVITTLDSQIQQMAEQALNQELERLKGMHVTNGAVLVVNPGSGEILAMVGSKNYFDTAHDGQVNVTIRARQPGSSIKPLTYALALSDRLITPATLIEDTPVSYQIAGSPVYSPQNYDGRYHGRVTVRQALANSYNIPAVKTLAQVGVMNLVGFSERMGITTWTNPNRFGLSLTLGGGEVKMTDMATAYGVFANMGRRVPLTPILRVADYTGSRNDEYACTKTDEELENVSINREQKCIGEQVIDPGVAFLVSDILADNQARSQAFGQHSVLVIPNQQVAVKTGTTNDLRDNWTFGYTKDYLVATWVGNNDNTPMSRVASGITGASPIWQAVMKNLLADQPTHTFSPPANVVRLPICPMTQTLNCGGCTNSRYEYFLSGTEPKQACTSEQIDQVLQPSPPEKQRDQLLEGVQDVRQERVNQNRELKKNQRER